MSPEDEVTLANLERWNNLAPSLKNRLLRGFAFKYHLPLSAFQFYPVNKYTPRLMRPPMELVKSA